MTSDQAIYFLKPLGNPLWHVAHWSATTFGWHPTSAAPPFMGIVFDDAEAGKSIFRSLKDHLTGTDLYEELRVSIIEGDMPGLCTGYTVHLCADPHGVINRMLGDGIDTDLEPEPVVPISRINRMNPAKDSPLLARFKKEFQKHGQFMLVPITKRADGQNWAEVSLGIVKTVIHFRNVADIGEKDLDAAVFQYAELVKLAEGKTLLTEGTHG
jgi:hypothetical protein